MAELKYEGVNADVKALEEQNENIKKSNTVNQTTKKMSFDPKNYLDLKLGENENEKTLKIRLLPISATDSTIFFEIITHALKVDKEIAQSGFKSYVCLNDEKIKTEESCPICNKSKKLFEDADKAMKDGNKALSKTLFKEACSLKKKRTFIVRVVDRDHEDEGVKFWRFNENTQGEGIYDKLWSLYKTRKEEAEEDGEENYSIFDLYNGKDIIITVGKSFIPDGFGGMKEKISYQITDSGNRKPLSKDVEKANAWLNDKKTWRDVYSLKPAKYLEIVVNGEIPVYDKEKGMFVAKKEINNNKTEIEKEASKILKENGETGGDVSKTENIKAVSESIVNNEELNNAEEDQLPF